MHYSHSGFFNFIAKRFGNRARYFLKKWSHANIVIIKTKAKIFFLRKCLKQNTVPQHLRFLYNNNISFFSKYSSTSYNSVVLRSIKCTLRIEISDLYKHLRFLQHNLLLYLRFMYSWILLFLTILSRNSGYFSVFLLTKRIIESTTNYSGYLVEEEFLPQFCLLLIITASSLSSPSIDNYKLKLRSHLPALPNFLFPLFRIHQRTLLIISN